MSEAGKQHAAQESPSHTAFVLAAALAIVVLTLVVDIVTPWGTAAGVFPYFLALVITAWSRAYWVPIAICGLTLAGLAAGALLSDGLNLRQLVTNRILLSAALLGVTMLVHMRQKSERRVLERQEALEEEVAARTASLRNALQKLKLAADSLKLGVWERDLVTGEVTWDRRMYEIMGRPDDYGRVPALEVWMQACHPEDFDSINDLRLKAIDEFGALHTQARIYWPDGSLHHVEIHALIETGPDGEARRMIGVTMDITERLKTEQTMQRAYRLEAVGQLTSGVAHDFNNLLSAIQNSLDLLKDVSQQDPTAAMAYRIANRASDRGADLTRRLLAFSRTLELKPAEADINALIQEFTELLRRTLGANIEIVSEFDPNVPKTLIDAGQLENAILNLAINARDAMPDGGVLTISTQVKTAPANGNGDARHYVNIRVSDTGSGMPPGVLEKVFEPYFTTKEDGKGSGLGLSMVYGFVKQSDGFVEIDSAEGRGTRIDLNFPLNGADERPA